MNNLELASKYFKAAQEHNLAAEEMEHRNDLKNAEKYRKWADAETKQAMKYSQKVGE